MPAARTSLAPPSAELPRLPGYDASVGEHLGSGGGMAATRFDGWPAAEDVAALVDAHYLICVLDRRGRIAYFNRACEESTGYAAEEAIGRDAREVVIPPDEAEAFAVFLDDAWATREPNPQLGHWLTRDGARRLIAWTNRPLEDDHLLTAGLDLTERGPASAELGRLHAELEARVAEISTLLGEQSALRRVATLVASGASPDAVFQAVSAE